MNEDIFHLGVKAIIRDINGKILLLKVNLRELKGQTGIAYWDLPGGRIQQGSSVENTLKRELKEETGILIKSIKPFFMVLSNIRIPVENGDVGLILSAYLCDVGNVSEIKISSEHTEAKWFSPAKATKLLEFKYPKEFTEKLKDLQLHPTGASVV